MYCKQVLVLLFAATMACCINGTTVKRGIFESNYGGGYENNYGNNGLGGPAVLPLPPLNYGKAFSLHQTSVSPAEIASAIQAAKEASRQVMESQRRVHEAKEEVLHQQHVSNHKQNQAALAQQRAEAAAAVQQQEAKAAANSLVLAQQRLAQAKNEVAEHQRIASEKESHAAAVIQKSANVAAHNIQKTDEAARKISYYQHTGTTALRQIANSKDGSLSATSAAVAASAASGNGDGHGNGGLPSWLGATKYIHLQPSSW